MSKVVHPFSHRLVVLRDWKSRWFATGQKYNEFLKTDVLVREFLAKRLRGFYVSQVIVERNQKQTRIALHTSRPGMIIGRQGEGIEKLKKDLSKFMQKKDLKVLGEVKVDVVEINEPDADAAIVAYAVAEGLEKRLPFRRVLKQTIDRVMQVRNVKGARIWVTGRLGGADIARSEQVKRGSIPLQTFRADVDFAREKAHMPYGDLGIKVWIYRGDVFNDKDSKIN
jgi:small subunit ribosomal protein S3